MERAGLQPDLDGAQFYTRPTGEQPDLAAVVAIIQAVSSEIDLERLVGTLMVTALEHAGGDRCLLVLKHGSTWIEAEAKAIVAGLRVDLRRTRVLRADLPEDILSYVVATPAGLTLDEAAALQLSDDEHIEMYKRRSVLCLPMSKQHRLTGLLYFENRQSSEALTPARLAVLRILASQAAICLENARLYSELKRTEANLEEAQRITHTGHYGLNTVSGEIFWSEEVYRIYEVDPDTKLTVDLIYGRAHPEERQLIKDFIEIGPHDGKKLDIEHRLVMPNGSIKYIQIVVRAVRDELGEINLVGTAADITSMKQAQFRLETTVAEVQKQASLIESSGFFVGYGSAVGHFHYLNLAARRLAGIEPDANISAYQMNDLYRPEDRNLYASIVLPALLRDGRWEGECVVRNMKTGADVDVMQTVFFDSDRNVAASTGVTIICRDITEYKRQMTIQKEAEEALQKARAELAHVARLTTMGEFAASIAHELNQPLMAIVTSAETCLLRLAKEPPELDKAQEAAERVVRNGHRAAHVVKSIRAMIQKSEPSMEPLDINSVVRDVLDLLLLELRRHGVSVNLELRSDLKPVIGDRVQLEQVVMNLVTNGIEAMSGVWGGQRILRVVTQPGEDANVLIEIEDSGAGMDRAKADRIFEPFFTTKNHGIGMGLPICRSIVEAHSGRLWVTPRLDRGSVFHLTLPMAMRGGPG
jgi:signal transduction histidine kinase